MFCWCGHFFVADYEVTFTCIFSVVLVADQKVTQSQIRRPKAILKKLSWLASASPTKSTLGIFKYF